MVRSTAAETMLKQLKNPFPPQFVKYRVGATNKAKTKGICLFYIDAREVMKRLDDICGIEGWQREMEAVTSANGLVGVNCKLSLLVPGTDGGVWISKSDFGEPSNTSPLKGASSDALKRAAVNFGVGRYLYYIMNTWYDLDEKRQFKTAPELPVWALPQQGLENWEDVAVKEYQAELDVDLDNLQDIEFTDEIAEKILKERKLTRDQIVKALKKDES